MGGAGKEARKVGFETGSGPFHRESRVATGERAGLDPRRFPGWPAARGREARAREGFFPRQGARAASPRSRRGGGGVTRARGPPRAASGPRARSSDRARARGREPHLRLGRGEDALVDELLRLRGGPLEERILIGHGGDVRGVGAREALQRRAVARAAQRARKGQEAARHDDRDRGWREWRQRAGLGDQEPFGSPAPRVRSAKKSSAASERETASPLGGDF